MDVLSSFLTLLAQGLLVVAIPVLVAAAAYWLKQKADEVKSKLTQEQLATLESIGAIAVRAAEQAGLSRQVAGGAAKKDYALKVAQDYLNRLGVKIDVGTVATVLEAEVLKQFNHAAPPMDSPATRAALIEKAVESAVLAAEQSGLKATAVTVGVSVGQQKKKYALDLAKKFLDDHGMKVDMTMVDGLIEAQIMKFKIQAAEGTKK
ncbi:MAG: hypothetical protein FJ030_12300 [Chloroflexi bacterium]|nr:hypothetical protein [Chloroflexota bacterium]